MGNWRKGSDTQSREREADWIAGKVALALSEGTVSTAHPGPVNPADTLACLQES